MREDDARRLEPVPRDRRFDVLVNVGMMQGLEEGCARDAALVVRAMELGAERKEKERAGEQGAGGGEDTGFLGVV